MRLPSLIGGYKLTDMLDYASRAPTGCFVELGVYRGGSANLLYELCERQNRGLHLFDTFSGMPYQGVDDHHKTGDFADCYLDEIKKALPKAHFHVGIFPETLPVDLKDIAFIHFDMDQYQAAKDVKAHLWERMVPGGILFIDDFEHLPPVGRAFREDFGDLPVRTMSSQFVIVKP